MSTAVGSYLPVVTDREQFFNDRVPSCFHDGQTNTLYVIPATSITRTDAPNITQFCLDVQLLEEKAIIFHRRIQKTHINTQLLRSEYGKLLEAIRKINDELNRISSHPEVPAFQRRIAVCKTACVFIIMNEISRIVASSPVKVVAV